MRQNLKSFVLGGILASSLGALAAVNIPNTFTAGQPIKAADINANFSSLKTAVDALQGSLTTHDHFGQLWKGSGTGLIVSTDDNNTALIGDNKSTSGGVGLAGYADNATGTGVIGSNRVGTGVLGYTFSGKGVLGQGDSGTGVLGQSTTGTGVVASSVRGSAAQFTNNSSTAATLLLKQFSTAPVIEAQNFEGSVTFSLRSTGDAGFSGDVFAKGVKLTSDRNLKTNFASVDALGVLEKVVRLPVSRWNYKADPNTVRHVGPMAQDFHEAFGLDGTDDTHISSIDEGGVALAAIQGLNAKLEAENAKLRSSLADLEVRFSKLERR
jgi:Chaperone of endosialidase